MSLNNEQYRKLKLIIFFTSLLTVGVVVVLSVTGWVYFLYAIIGGLVFFGTLFTLIYSKVKENGGVMPEDPAKTVETVSTPTPSEDVK